MKTQVRYELINCDNESCLSEETQDYETPRQMKSNHKYLELRGWNIGEDLDFCSEKCQKIVGGK